MPASTAASLLTRDHHRRQNDDLPFLGDLSLGRARVHEACGPARHTFALMVMAATRGPVIWIAAARQAAGLHPDGISRFVDPGRLIFAKPKRDGDLLWSMEEALRAGCVSLVVADLPLPPALTPVRRLHLAAETGATEGTVRPTGLVLTPGAGGAQGVESRWDMAHSHAAAGARTWALHRRRARMAPEASWQVGITGKTFALISTPRAE
ncbi:MAG: hypothetical protein AAFX45_06220 [Pseudomonadota bacterium]